jgi:hypothetical protein
VIASRLLEMGTEIFEGRVQTHAVAEARRLIAEATSNERRAAR